MTEIDPRCLAAAEALANGDAAAMTAHAKQCGSCAFLATLLRDLPQTVGTADIGRTFEVALERAIDTGETLLSRYTIDSIIARGGQGIVCRATDRELGPVAIKILRCKPRTREARLPEGRVAMKLAGEGVCRIFNIERHGDIRLVVMELVEGTSLEDALPRLVPGQRLAIFRRVCGAVARMHSEGILHLDLKPRNIVLSAGDKPVVTDFGIAVALERDGRALPLGHTRVFAPPEQIAGERVDRRADVHALGVTLDLLLPRAPAHVRRVIARATSRDPERRHRDAAELLADLDRPVRVRRTILRATAAVAALGFVGGGTVLGLWQRFGRGPDVIVDFDGVDTYGRPQHRVDVSETNVFQTAGITAETSAGTQLFVENTLGFYEGRALVPTSPPNVLTQRGSNDPVSFTLTFHRPVARVTFRRPALIPATASGVTFPQWKAIALDAHGAEIARDGDAAFGSHRHVPPRDVALGGRCIVAVRFESASGHSAGFSAIVLDDLTLTYGHCE